MIDPGRERVGEGIVTGLKNEVRAVNDDRAQARRQPTGHGRRERERRERGDSVSDPDRAARVHSIYPGSTEQKAMTGAQKKVGQDKHRTERASKQVSKP